MSNNPIDYSRLDPMVGVGSEITNSPYYLGSNRRLQKQAEALAQEQQYVPIRYGKVETIDPNAQAGKYDEYGDIDTPYASVEEAQAVAAALPKTPDGIYTTKTRTRTQTRVKTGSGQRRKQINYGRSK